jgi:hypothetical protein
MAIDRDRMAEKNIFHAFIDSLGFCGRSPWLRPQVEQRAGHQDVDRRYRRSSGVEFVR